jgi:hypothetical protein
LSLHTYNDDLKIKDALQIYFDKYHFKDGGYEDKYFKIALGPVYIPVPNTKSRIAAVKIHDIHHILTGYPAVLKGEAEIGAWEIASGCGKYYVAWFLNFGSFFYGMFFFPHPLFKAFMRGRTSKTSLYYNTDYNGELLNKTVGELKKELEVDRTIKPTIRDYAYFIFCCLLVLVGIFTVCMLVEILFRRIFSR